MKLTDIKRTAIVKTKENPDVIPHGEFLFLLRTAVLTLEKQVNFLVKQNETHNSRIRILEEEIRQLKRKKS